MRATQNTKNKNELKLVAGFSALAICIHLFESSLPSIMGIKPGLANIVTIIVLLRFNLKIAAQVQLLRVFVASLLNGSIFSPTFFLSLSGSLCALLALSIIYCYQQSILKINHNNPSLLSHSWQASAISFSVAAALAHMLGQFSLAYIWLIPHAGLFKLLPILLSLALAFGWVNGIIAQKVLLQLSSQDLSVSTQKLSGTYAQR